MPNLYSSKLISTFKEFKNQKNREPLDLSKSPLNRLNTRFLFRTYQR
nr:MAG TPA: hypothetical protein [Caudoviricetes sp.]